MLAALDLFVERGYAETTIDQIAEEDYFATFRMLCLEVAIDFGDDLGRGGCRSGWR